MASSSAAGRSSADFNRPDTSDLRIVLLGKNISENSKVEKFIQGSALYCEAPSYYSQQHNERHITVINTPHLLQPHLTPHQITQRVRECVSRSAPGPHVILLVLQNKDFSEEDRKRVKYVLNFFSEKAIKHTIVLTTDEEALRAKLASMVMNNAIHNLIKECGNRHLRFDTKNSGWCSEMVNCTENILKEENEEFIVCNMYEDEDDGTSVDGEPENSGHKGGGQFYQSTKTGSNVVSGPTSGKTKMNFVLCGYNTTLKNSVSKIFRGIQSKPQKEMSKVCVKREGKIDGRQITVIELPALTRLSEEEVMRETLNCLSLCDPGVHVFILVTPVGSLTNEDKAEMEKIKRLFNSNEHFMVLFTAERPVDQSVSELVLSTESQRVVSVYGSWYYVMGIKDHRNSGQILKILDYIDTIKIEPYSLQMFMGAQEKRVRHELEEKLSVRDKEIKELQEKIKTPEGVKLNLVLCGKESLKSFISDLILNQSERGSHLSSEFMRKQVELHGRLISLLELPALFNTQLSEEEVMRQTLRCVSLCDPGVHVFIIIIPDAPLNNEDKAEMEKIQRIFSSRINKHTMILIHQNSEPQTAELNEENQSVVERFGGRHQFIGPNTPVSMLMEKLEQMVEENRGVCFSKETLWDVQMEKLQKFEEMNRRIHSQDSKERADEVRIVMLGKTGVGKSSTGNTILGRNMFTAESSAESVTKECKRETCQIKGRHITVIDTPGLFDTDLTNEEIQREITNCISMILPGPHVFLLLIPVGRFTQEEANAVKIIQETFGENSLKFTIVLFTRGDDLDNKSIEQWLGKPGSPLMKLIEVCGNRYHVFNNKQTGDRTQVSDLLKKIDDMVKENGDSYYSCKMFREMEREIQEKEKERMKMMMEEERQNYDKEIKKREEEFREREKQYKTEIKEREEQERKMRKEIRREREEWDREKEQERRRRDEEDERRRKKEQVMWDTCNKRLEQEIQRRLRDRDDLQLKYEEEKGKMMKEFRERDKLYKRDIKDIEDQERKIREEMKREREEWEKQKQEERQREEKETQRSNELHTETPEGQLTNNDEDSPPDQECLRILLFGKRGNGKSATGNTILGTDEFHSEDSSNPVTTLCQKGVGEVGGKSITVVDTPGLFDTTLANEQVVEQIVKCVSLSAPGPHVFIIVLSLGRITQEERDTLDMIKMIFGPKAAEFSIVLFTRGDDLKKQTIQQYVEKSKNDELKTMIRDCGNRFLAFKNRETQDRTQVTDLINMIEELKNSNEGRFFTNETFEAAISNEQRREMIEENKRKNQAQVEELEDKYDMEMKRMIERLKEKKRKTDEERVKLENKFRGKQEKLMREFEEKEKSEQKKQEKEDQKRSEEKQRRDEYDQRLEEMKKETENQRSQDEKQQKEREEVDRMREEKYRQDEEKMKTEQEHMMAELRGKQEEEIKKRDLEEQMRKEQEEKEREEWKRKITETENDKEIQEDMKRQQREWEEEKKRQMREREEEEREIKERHEEQMREKQEELEKMRERFETDREEERQMIEEERQKQEREREDKENEMNRRYEELKRERKEWERRKQEDEERRVEKRKRWEEMMEDLKQEQEEEIKRREREERETIEREEKECDEMKQKYKDEIEKMKKKHQDEARKQEEELNDFEERKKKHIEEFKGRLEEELNKVKKLREELKEKWSCRVM